MRYGVRFLFIAGVPAVMACGDETTVEPEEPLLRNVLPVAAFRTDVDVGPAPLTVHFDASPSSDSDGSIERYLWTFPDSVEAEGVRASHTFTEPGTHAFGLTVTDDRHGEGWMGGYINVSTPVGSGPNSIHGRIWFDRNLDDVMDQDEEKLDRFMVFLDDNGDGRLDAGEIVGFSGDDGTYEIRGLEADRSYTVTQTLQLGWTSTFAGVAAASDPRVAAIINGEEALENEFPFMVALRTTSGFQFCGGTLVNSRYVLTAAHCVAGRQPEWIKVLIGTVDLEDGGEELDVDRVYWHPNFGQTIDWDVALLRVTEPLMYPRIYVQEPFQWAHSEPGDTATAIGWGQTEEGEGSQFLLKTRVPIISNKTCDEIAGIYFSAITPRVICAGNLRLNRGVCYGDSGGPLMVPYKDSWLEVGITSFTVNRQGCGEIPAAYARVTALYDYILEVAGIETSLAYEVDWSTGDRVRVDFGNFH
ncbi:MAG: trypsin-like serine protease [Gemmatimonadota bacterium]|nr:trypsin-like serine protease [Gemmatimonadota bacterium]